MAKVLLFIVFWHTPSNGHSCGYFYKKFENIFLFFTLRACFNNDYQIPILNICGIYAIAK